MIASIRRLFFVYHGWKGSRVRTTQAPGMGYLQVDKFNVVLPLIYPMYHE